MTFSKHYIIRLKKLLCESLKCIMFYIYRQVSGPPVAPFIIVIALRFQVDTRHSSRHTHTCVSIKAHLWAVSHGKRAVSVTPW